MADQRDPFYKPGLVIPPRTPTPGRHQWTLTKADRRLDCEIRIHGEYGAECQLLKNGEFYAGRRFDTYAAAVQFAQAERAILEQDGWHSDPQSETS